MGTEVKYEPLVIKKHAAKLYSRANSIVLTYSLLGFILGAAGGFVGMTVLAAGGELDAGMSVVIVTGLVGLLFGYSMGSERAFALRLQAQVALCQVSIETNTLDLRRLVSSAIPTQHSGAGPQPAGFER